MKVQALNFLIFRDYATRLYHFLVPLVKYRFLSRCVVNFPQRYALSMERNLGKISDASAEVLIGPEVSPTTCSTRVLIIAGNAGGGGVTNAR